ncbi:MAG: radical SAM protein [Desulfobacteraceae bacterium]|nr:radical SAM protein [Desulfobacteraceae bacterium]
MLLKNESVYINTFKTGLLEKKVFQAKKLLKNCDLCPRQCNVNRTSGEFGFCKTGMNSIVCSMNPHFGEERPLVGKHGSGTIFFSSCNLLCNFCQNYEISHKREGQEITDDKLALMMLFLQQQGCHNINFVTPSHVVPQILSALQVAIPQGLSVPIVYNTGGYDSIKTLQLLDGIIDIYMPDFKFFSPETAKIADMPEDYPEVVKQAICEMHKQVGDLVIDSSKVAQRGLLVRHLVLPDGLAGTKEIMNFLSKEISTNTYVNIMSQYRPCGTAHKVESLSRNISVKEYKDALEIAKNKGMKRLD